MIEQCGVDADLKILRKEVDLDKTQYLLRVAAMVQRGSELVQSVELESWVNLNDRFTTVIETVKSFILKTDTEGYYLTVCVDGGSSNQVVSETVRILSIIDYGYIEQRKCIVIRYKL